LYLQWQNKHTEFSITEFREQSEASLKLDAILAEWSSVFCHGLSKIKVVKVSNKNEKR
jgi:hypothetical protein